MKLWLISQDDVTDYDTYDAAVVAAETEEEAKAIHPGEEEWKTDRPRSWAKSPDLVRAKLIGDALIGTEKGVIIASFNAG